jgi:cytochrome c oxidase subunit IV
MAVIAGLTLLLIVDVHGLAFYIAWSLIVLALLSEGVATAVYWQRSRGGRGPPAA